MTSYDFEQSSPKVSEVLARSETIQRLLAGPCLQEMFHLSQHFHYFTDSMYNNLCSQQKMCVIGHFSCMAMGINLFSYLTLRFRSELMLLNSK